MMIYNSDTYDTPHAEAVSPTLNAACCSMCLSKEGFETEVKSHSEHWNRFPDQTEKTDPTFKPLHTQVQHVVSQTNRLITSKQAVTRRHHQWQSWRTLVSVAQPVAFQRDFGLELFAAQITEVTPLCVVSVHVGLQVIPAAAGVVAHAAHVGLQTWHTCTNTHLHEQRLDTPKRMKCAKMTLEWCWSSGVLFRNVVLKGRRSITMGQKDTKDQITPTRKG